MAHNTLLHDIKTFLAATGMSAYRFGFLAARNGRLVERLEAGGRIWPDTEQRVRDFIRSSIAEHSADTPPSRRSV